MKRPIHESLEAKLVATQSSISLDNLFQLWSSKKYGTLSVLLANLRSLSILHHQNHWVTTGQGSYQDHLLFQRLYEGVDGEVDSVGERCVGLGGNETVDLTLQIKTMWAFIKENMSSGMTMPAIGNDLVQKSLNAEFMFLTLANTTKETLSANGLLSAGLDNMIAGLQDAHETNVYLLKQRLGQ
jgi:DNA-binding ferritin-like protein